MGILSHRHTHLHTHIVLCPGNTPCHLLQQSHTPGASLILMNSGFFHNYPPPGLWENKRSGAGLLWLRCRSLYQLLQPPSYNTHLIALESLAITSCIDQKSSKAFHKLWGLVLLVKTSMMKLQLYLIRATAGTLGFILGSTELMQSPVSPRRVVQHHAKAHFYLFINNMLIS